MVRREQIRRRVEADPQGPDSEPTPDRLPQRPAADTRNAAAVLERIRRLLTENRSR